MKRKVRIKNWERVYEVECHTWSVEHGVLKCFDEGWNLIYATHEWSEAEALDVKGKRK